jgi:hypothetical protein
MLDPLVHAQRDARPNQPPHLPVNPPCDYVHVCVCVCEHAHKLTHTHTNIQTCVQRHLRDLYISSPMRLRNQSQATYHRQSFLTSPPPLPLCYPLPPLLPCSAAATVTTPALLSAAPFTVKSILEEGPAHSSGKISLGDTLTAIDDQVECPASE